MKLRISLLVILISMLFASCGISTGKGTEQKGEEISVLRYDRRCVVIHDAPSFFSLTIKIGSFSLSCDILRISLVYVFATSK